MQRIKSLDFARGFTVLMIAPIHTVMLYGTPDVHQSLLGYGLAFIAEWHGAEIFMLLMGISFGLKENQPLAKTAHKTAWLVVAAYALNLFKFVLPGYLHLLPMGLYHDLQLADGTAGLRHLFLLGDILIFAALAVPCLLVVSKIRNAHIFALVLGFVIIFASPFFWDLHSSDPFVNYCLRLLGGQPPLVYFPLLPWLAYPLIGLSMGYWLRQNKCALFNILPHIGLCLMLTGVILQQFGMVFPETSFYRTYPLDTMQRVGFVLLALAFWNWIEANVSHSKFLNFLESLSKNITQLYLIQWVVICWLLPLFGYHNLNMLACLMAICATTALTLFFSFIINRIKH